MKLKKINKGDTVGIVCPAGSIKSDDKRIKVLEERLGLLGLNYKYGNTIGKRVAYLGGSDEERAADLMTMYQDSEVKIILAMLGGYGCSRIVDKLDYEIIKANPKPLIGFSDLTVLLNTVNKLTSQPTIHGPVGIYLGKQNFDEFSLNDFSDILFKKQLGRVLKNPNDDAITLNGGVVRGRLVGGNLSLIDNLIGTPYEVDFTDKIVFIEEVDEKPYAFDRYLAALRLSGNLEKARGFVIGYLTDIASGDDDAWTAEDLIKQYFSKLNKPVIYNFRSGHDLPFINLPIGLEVELDANNKTIKILEEMYETD